MASSLYVSSHGNSNSQHTSLIHPIPVTHPIRIRTTQSLWCSAPCPTGEKPLFAIGTSDGLRTLEGVGSYWSFSKKPFPNDVVTGQPVLHRRTDSSHALVTSVEWLSSNVIASGLKDSTIFLHDLRSGGTATRLQHAHSVVKIRRVDPYRLVVAGQRLVGGLITSFSFPPCPASPFGLVLYLGGTKSEYLIRNLIAPNVRHPLPTQRPPTKPQTN